MFLGLTMHTLKSLLSLKKDRRGKNFFKVLQGTAKSECPYHFYT